MNNQLNDIEAQVGSGFFNDPVYVLSKKKKTLKK